MAIFKISKSYFWVIYLQSEAQAFTQVARISLKSCPQNFQKLPKSCSFHQNVAQKLLFINSKKSVSTTDESKSLHIYTNYLLIYIFLPTRLHSYTYRDDILVPPPVYLILHQFMGVCFKYRQFTFNKNHAIYHSMMLTNKTLFENIYKFDDCHIRICVHYFRLLNVPLAFKIVAN